MDPIRQAELMAARWQAILDTAQDAIISIDRDGRITLFNRSAEAIFGYAAGEVTGRPVTMLMPSPWREAHDGYIEHYRRTGEARAIGRIRDVRALRKNGEEFPIELSVSEARVGDDLIYSAVIRDVAAKRAAERALEEARRETAQRARLADIGALTAYVVHDLGNPIAGMSMLIQRILRRMKMQPSQPIEQLAEPVDQLRETVRRMEGIVCEFKEFARDQRLDLQAIDLPEFLRGVVTFWKGEANARTIDLELEQAAGDLHVSGDPDKLRRVFDNLLKNALEAIEQGPGAVRIRATALTRDRIVRVVVEDDGPGVPKDVDVFAMFETTKPTGTGLGLPICRQILEAHHGGISIASADPHGTAVTVDLPASDVADPAADR